MSPEERGRLAKIVANAIDPEAFLREHRSGMWLRFQLHRRGVAADQAVRSIAAIEAAGFVIVPPDDGR